MQGITDIDYLYCFLYKHIISDSICELVFDTIFLVPIRTTDLAWDFYPYAPERFKNFMNF